jgi:hypothetical protein
MRSFKKASLVIFSVAGLTTFTAHGDEPVCHRCEEIREYNAKHHENFEYYDEYVKTHEESGQKTAAMPATDGAHKETASTTPPTKSSSKKSGPSK